MPTPQASPCCARFGGQNPARRFRDAVPVAAPAGGVPRLYELARLALRRGFAAHARFGCGFMFAGSSGTAFQVRAQEYERLLGVIDDITIRALVHSNPDIAAKYYEDTDEVAVKLPGLADEQSMQATLVHELVHWIQDGTRFSGANWEWEASAYVGDTLWRAATAAFDLNIGVDDVLDQWRVQDSYLGFASGVLRDSGASRGTVLIRWSEVQYMKTLLERSGVYASVLNGRTTGNGV
jgi:hypothetical protein